MRGKKVSALHGFTVVELAIAVLVLALVIVVAVPRLVGQQTLQQRVAVDQAAGYFGSAVALGHAAWVVAGRPGAVTNVAGFRSGTFDFNDTGWPMGVEANVAEKMTPATCARLWEEIQDFELTVSSKMSNNDAAFMASAPQGNCLYEFSEDSDRHIHYDTETGRIVVANY